eukprot:749263-Hanusia_phi.AAC.2
MFRSPGGASIAAMASPTARGGAGMRRKGAGRARPPPPEARSPGPDLSDHNIVRPSLAWVGASSSDRSVHGPSWSWSSA